jgi:Icc-related predicted phosphoesterase
MRFLVLADMDDLWWEHGEGQADVLLACGDLSDDVIRGAAEEYHCKRIFAVKGNHDRIESFPVPIHDLHLKVVEYDGLTFGGLNGSSKYKPRGSFLYEQEEIAAALANFPPVDVFVSHNSPRGVHDKEDGAHYGFEGLLAYIERAKPKLVLHGHQHISKATQIGPTRVIGIYGNRLIDFSPRI